MEMWMLRVHIYASTALRRDRVASPTFGHLEPRYSVYRRLSGPQDQSGYEGVKKNLHPSDTGIEPMPSSPESTGLSLELPGSQKKQ